MRTAAYIDPWEHNEQREQRLMEAVGLIAPRAGLQELRDHSGWRHDEKYVEYMWIISIDRFPVGLGGVFGIKLNEHKFRQFEHSEEHVTGIFRANAAGDITGLYTQREQLPFHDRVMDSMRFDLFNATNKGIALDGIGYNVHVISTSIDTVIRVNNPTTKTWKIWETELFILARPLSFKSNNPELMNLFA